MKILVVDDNKAYLEVMSNLLRDAGHEVMVAEDGKEARELLEIETFSLIISDVFMPRLDGTRFHSYVREFAEVREIPFIFVSGFDDETTRKLVENSQCDFFFSKTAAFDDIAQLIAKLETRQPLTGHHAG
jgi:CheY-like chemotaxis protein